MNAKTLYPLIIIVILVFGINFNTLFNDFVYDDNHEVLQNHWIRDIKYLPEIFSSNSWGFAGRDSNYYRPLNHVIRMINYHIFGFVPWGFHLVNVIFHAGVSVLVFLIAGRLFTRADKSFFTIPFVAAALFAAHPIHTEQVAWVSSIAGLSLAFFYLLSLYFYITATSEGHTSKVGYVLSVVSFFLALLSKEQALTLPVVIMIYDYLFRYAPQRKADYAKRYLPYLLVAGIYFILRMLALKGFVPVISHSSLTVYQYAINVFPFFVKYLGKLVLPVHLNAYYVFHPVLSIFEPEAIISLAVTTVFIAMMYRAFKKNRTLFFSFSLIVIPLLPALYIPAFGVNAFSERYLYLPSFGFVLLVSSIFAWARSKSKRWAIAVTTGFFLVLVVYSVGVVSRNTVWKNDYSLWQDTVRKSPDGYVPHNSFGKASHQRGLIDDAIEHFNTALKLYPRHAEAHNNLGVIYGGKGLTDKAMEHFQIAIQLNPDYADAHNNIGIAYGSRGWFSKAREHFQAAIHIRPGFDDFHHNMAVTCMNLGLIDEAIAYFQNALKLNPNAVNTHLGIAKAYEIKGMTSQAETHRQEATKLGKR